MPYDESAPVLRVKVGDRVLCEQGPRVRPMTVVGLSDEDAVHAENGSPIAPWGIYFGRSVALRCDDAECQCRTTEWRHGANECQLAATNTVGVFQPALFEI